MSHSENFLKVLCLVGILASGVHLQPLQGAPLCCAYTIGKHVYRNDIAKHLSIDINHSNAGLYLVQFN